MTHKISFLVGLVLLPVFLLRETLRAAPASLEKKSYWSYAFTDAIDKLNYLPLKRNGILQPSPHTFMHLHDYPTDTTDKSGGVLSYGQPEYMINMEKYKI